MPRHLRFWLIGVLGFCLVLGSSLGLGWPMFSTVQSPPPLSGLVQAGQPPTATLSFLGPTQFRGKTVAQVKVPAGQKVIALTFDDGPWGTSTTEVLAILAQHEVKATFFWIGAHLQRYPEVAKQVVKAGHAVGNHTWNHTYKPVTEEIAIKEIENTSFLIAKTTKVQTRLFRPPGGILNNGLVAYATKKNYTTLMWSVDPHDSAPKGTSEDIIKRVLAQAKPGGIILLHDGGGDRQATIKALPAMITKLKAKGYSFVTIPELLRLGGGTPKPSPTPLASPVPSPTPSLAPDLPKPKPAPTTPPEPPPAEPAVTPVPQAPPTTPAVQPIPLPSPSPQP
ncbi:polysaccharide deacetylase family protein [Thermosynechococcaceae cyanobacterium BACA0444]|uniref:Polysaccharide deacetylase family protein n=1 Tax=Pseudocalidococcus azoricus BACA0444 TaxID=2918990 RepID=A0AAE4FVP7_9CYAN|nr:polysaccharide deacetylase family protein [Pseudocalidococcus azoricus]MDS3862179.1 polysaccharide deacetylase family protein [Pseudocalidococcus azoricus BACA0444]